MRLSGASTWRRFLCRERQENWTMSSRCQVSKLVQLFMFLKVIIPLYSQFGNFVFALFNSSKTDLIHLNYLYDSIDALSEATHVFKTNHWGWYPLQKLSVPAPHLLKISVSYTCRNIDQQCNRYLIIIAVDGAWSLWSRYSKCSGTCGQGTRTRTRKCVAPRPKFGGRDCTGIAEDVEQCYHHYPCPGKKQQSL